jgi:hypothetical protein
MVWVTEAVLHEDYKIRIRFNDETSGIIDFEPVINKDHRKVITDLLNKQQFEDFTVDLDTIVWSNGADFAPEYLYELCKKSQSVA